MKKIFPTIVLILSSVFIFLKGQSQITFQKTYGTVNDDGGNYVQQTNDGGYIIAGYTTNVIGGLGQDINLIKIDSIGQLEWSKSYGSTANEYGTFVQQTFDGGYIIVANGNYLIKTNSSGDTLWTAAYSGITEINSAQQTSDFGFIFCGAGPNGIGGSVGIIEKVDNMGHVTWSKSFINPTGFSNVLQTNDYGYIACGSYGFGAGNPDLGIVKLTSTGDTLWSKHAGSLGILSVMQKTRDGGYIFGGNCDIVGVCTGGGYYFYFFKTDANGNALWFKEYNSTSVINSLTQTNTGEYAAIVSGSLTVLKFDSLGNFQWESNYAQSNYSCSGKCVQPTNDGGFIFVGGTGSSNSGNDIFLVKTDGNGVVNCNDSSIIVTPSSAAFTLSNIALVGTAGNTGVGGLSNYYIETPSTVAKVLCSSVTSCPAITTTATQIGNSSSAYAMASGGTGPYTYRWSNTETVDTATSLTTGSYSVTATDQNGCTGTATVSVTVTTGIVASGGVTSFSLYPNPSAGIFMASIHLLATSDVTLTVTDVTGQKIYECKDNGVKDLIKPIHLPTASVGIYFVNVRTAEGSDNQRIVIK